MEPGAVAVLDGHGDRRANRAVADPRRFLLDDQLDVAADKALPVVGRQDARQEVCLAENLEAVADAEYRATSGSELGDGAHNR